MTSRALVALAFVACGGATAVESSNTSAADASAPGSSPTIHLPVPPDATPPDPGFYFRACENPDAAAPLPLTTIIPASCAKDYVMCRDGTYAARTGPNCELPMCRCSGVCDAIGSMCLDGTFPTTDVPNCGDHCAAQSCEVISKNADVRQKVFDPHGCQTDDDCTVSSVSVSCSPSCAIAVTKRKLTDLDGLRRTIEDTHCALFRAQGCVSPPTPPCDPPTPPKCVNRKCQ